MKGAMPAVRARRQRGFSLVEVLIAVVLLAVIAGPVLAMFLSSTRTAALSRDMTVATYTTQLIMEEMKGLTSAELDAYLAGRTEAAYDADKGIHWRAELFDAYEIGGVPVGFAGDMRGVRVVALTPDGRVISSFSNILYPESG